jgi:hypothetical protein
VPWSGRCRSPSHAAASPSTRSACPGPACPAGGGERRPRETPTAIASTGIQACEAVAVVSRVTQNQNHRGPASEPRARLRAFLDKQAVRRSARGAMPPGGRCQRTRWPSRGGGHARHPVARGPAPHQSGRRGGGAAGRQGRAREAGGGWRGARASIISSKKQNKTSKHCIGSAAHDSPRGWGAWGRVAGRRVERLEEVWLGLHDAAQVERPDAWRGAARRGSCEATKLSDPKVSGKWGGAASRPGALWRLRERGYMERKWSRGGKRAARVRGVRR